VPSRRLGLRRRRRVVFLRSRKTRRAADAIVENVTSRSTSRDDAIAARQRDAREMPNVGSPPPMLKPALVAESVRWSSLECERRIGDNRPRSCRRKRGSRSCGCFTNGLEEIFGQSTHLSSFSPWHAVVSAPSCR